jgi:hypothetical protein
MIIPLRAFIDECVAKNTPHTGSLPVVMEGYNLS